MKGCVIAVAMRTRASRGRTLDNSALTAGNGEEEQDTSALSRWERDGVRVVGKAHIRMIMSESGKRRTIWVVFNFLLVATVMALFAVGSVFLSLGIAVHDTIYVANPALGPDGWTKYTEQIIGFVMLIVRPLFLLLLAWMIACTAFLVALNRNKESVAVEPQPDGGGSKPAP